MKANENFIETLKDIQKNGVWSTNPRTKWSDGSPAHYKSVFQVSNKYNILAGEFPVQTYRKTAFKGAFYDIEAIYMKQTNIIEEMHPSIHPWWVDFITDTLYDYVADSGEVYTSKEKSFGFIKEYKTIGQTYGHTVKRYDLMNKVLKDLETNPNSRRILMNLWQEQQMLEDPKALVPCAYQTKWNVTQNSDINFIDMTLTQRSMDFLMTASINPIQYVFLGLMVANHITYKTGKIHKFRFFKHDIEDVHIYDRHMFGVEELLSREPNVEIPNVELICEPKDFYSHTWEDFKITGIQGIEPLSKTLEIAT